MAWLLSLLQRSFIGRFFTSYDKANERFERVEAFITGEKSSVHKRRFARLTENNRLFNFIPKMFGYFMTISLRDYGVMMFMTGIVVAILYPLNNMILFIDVTFEMFVFGCATSLSSIPLLFSSKSLASNILASKLFSSILFDFLGLDSESVRLASEKSSKHITTVAFLIGAALGVGSYFILPIYTVLLVGLVVLAYCTMRTPEIGVVATVFSIPFAGIEIVSICVAYTFICYIIKVLLGKRIFKFEYFDFWICITIVAMTAFGINYRDPISSLRDIGINLTIMLSYFMFSNLIHSKEWFKRSIVAFTMSSLIVAIVAVAQSILLKLYESIEALEPIFPKGINITSTLGSRNSLAQFLVIAIPFALVHMISEKNEVTKFGGFLMSALLVAALILTGSASAIVGLMVGAMLLFAFYDRKAVYLILIVCIALPILYFTLPKEILTLGPLKGTSIHSEIEYIKQGFLAAIERPYGIGLGTTAFEGSLPQYADGFIDCLPIQLLATYGTIGCGVFVLFVIVFARLMLSYAVKAKNEYRRVNCCAGLCSALGIFAAGVFNYVWEDKRIFLLLIVTIGLSFAYIKIDREEDATVKEYIDISCATLDIQLKDEPIGELVPSRRYVHTLKVRKHINKRNKEKKAEAKEFSNTQELDSVDTE